MSDPGPASSRVPLEIWTQIIALACEPETGRWDPRLPSMWETGRRVSRTFKAATEAAYVSTFLRDPDIAVSVQACRQMAIESDLYKSNTSIWDWCGGPQQYMVFEFDRLASDRDHGDGSRAVWKLRPPVTERNEWLIASPRESSKNRDTFSAFNFYPVELDGLVIDYENHEVSILWKIVLGKLIAKYRELTNPAWFDDMESGI